MIGVTCSECAFWRKMNQHKVGGRQLGQCRLKGPTLELVHDHQPRTLWPLTREDDWCGEHSVYEGDES